MEYLRITNKGAVNRRFFELIGVSTKRDAPMDADVIGQKGSGTKLAAVGALRLGMDVVIASSDAGGRYLLQFESRPIKVGDLPFRQVVYSFAEESADDPRGIAVVKRDSSLVVESFSDWDRPIGADDKRAFKVLREFVCNAYDEDKDFSLHVVDAVSFAPAGTTAVHISMTDELRAMLGDPRRYLKFLAKERSFLAVDGIGEVFLKSDSKTRLFMMGVLAACVDAASAGSLFDYSLRKKSLVNEDRLLTDMRQYESELGRLFGSVTDESFMRRVITAAEAGEARFEQTVLAAIQPSKAGKSAWLAAARKIHGEKIAVTSGKDQLDRDAEQIFGYEVVGKSNLYLRTFYERLGVPLVTAIMPKTPERVVIRFEDLENESRKDFTEAFRMFARHFPEYADYPIVLYFPLAQNLGTYSGFAGSGDRAFLEIWVAAKTLTALPPADDILKTLVHEGRHCFTRAGDYDRAFVNRADNEIATLVYRLERRDSFGFARSVPMPGPPGRAPKILSPQDIRDREAAKRAAARK